MPDQEAPIRAGVLTGKEPGLPAEVMKVAITC